MSRQDAQTQGRPGSGLFAAAGLVAVALMLAAGIASAQTTGVRGSKHDLSAVTGATTGTTEVCVFCHTPHGANTGASAPLWNKTLPATTYTRYSSLPSSTLDGGEATVGSVSLACLSCHDGTQAMDVVINAPGSGNYDSAGSRLDPTVIGQMTNPIDPGTITPANPDGTAGPIPALGTDLRDDHPISIQYAGGGCSATAGDATANCVSTSFKDTDFNTLTAAEINGVPQWWIDANTAIGRQKDDIILYTRTALPATTGAVEPFVECGSCHDPHEAAERPVSFMRIDNSGSAVCLACHNK